jgi:hypothetical protein
MQMGLTVITHGQLLLKLEKHHPEMEKLHLEESLLILLKVASTLTSITKMLLIIL